jgi:hypothetical protein
VPGCNGRFSDSGSSPVEASRGAKSGGLRSAGPVTSSPTAPALPGAPQRQQPEAPGAQQPVIPSLPSLPSVPNAPPTTPQAPSPSNAITDLLNFLLGQ